jgi:hypothetical protein
VFIIVDGQNTGEPIAVVGVPPSECLSDFFQQFIFYLMDQSVVPVFEDNHSFHYQWNTACLRGIQVVSRNQTKLTHPP